MKSVFFVASRGLGGLVLGALAGLIVGVLAQRWVNDGPQETLGFSLVNFALSGAVFGLLMGLAAGIRRRP